MLELQLRKAAAEAVEMAAALRGEVGIVGYGHASVRDRLGRLKSAAPFANLVTDVGDAYYARMSVVGVSPNNVAAPTLVNGMKLGTGSGATTKAGALSHFNSYLSASGVFFDTGFPTWEALATTLGARNIYQCTWPGTGLAGALTEACIVTDKANNADGGASVTIARALYAVQNKGGTDTFAITWYHKFLGA